MDVNEYADEILSVAKMGPPRGLVRIRKPEVFHIRKAEQLEGILEANVATFGIVSDEEVEEVSASIVANYEFLKLQLESKEPVQDESHLKAPTIAYPRSQREDIFVDGIEIALGPGSLFRISKKLPKVRALRPVLFSDLVIVLPQRIHPRAQRVGYVYTSSEPEESEIEEASDIPTEDEQVEEATKLDTTVMETAEYLTSAVGIERSVMGVDEDNIEDVADGVEAAGSRKRKASSDPEGDKQSRRAHPKLEDKFFGPKRAVTTVDEKTIAKWVASLEMLVKGKVKMGRRVRPITQQRRCYLHKISRSCAR